MTVLLTTAGIQHISQRFTGTPLTNVFDGCELGLGAAYPTNTPLAVTHTRDNLVGKVSGSIRQVASGYPKLNDTDIRNDGRGALVYTWKFVYPEGSQLIASHAVVTNYAAGAPVAAEPLLIHTDVATAKRLDQEMTLFFNVHSATSATSFVAHVENGTPLVEQVASYRQQSISLSGAPGATPVSNGIVQSKLGEGEQAWIGARLLDGDGGVMTSDSVVAILVTAYRRDREREWVVGQEESIDPGYAITSAPVRTDPRWRMTQGYNFSHAWRPPSGWGARRTRLEYTFTLTTGDLRTIVHEIEWASMRAQ